MHRAYLLMHKVTGTCLPGYRVNAAQQQEIDQANHRLAKRGSDYRFVVDVHSAPRDLPQQPTAEPTPA